MSLDLDTIWERGLDVLASAVNATTKTITAMLGNSVTEETLSPNAEWWQHPGFSSRPANPTKGQHSAQVIVLKGSDVDAVIASRDIRGQGIYGNLGPGETAVYALGEDGTGQARSLYKSDGSINHYTRVGNTENGDGMVCQLDAANNVARLLNGAGNGIIADATSVTLTAGTASITLHTDGKIEIVGTSTVVVDGSLIVIGQASVPPAPGINAALKGPSGVAGTASTKVIIGT